MAESKLGTLFIDFAVQILNADKAHQHSKRREKMAWGMRNIVISLFGSSIIEGRIGAENVDERYYMILQQKLAKRCPEVCFSIINGAVGGWSTRELMEIFDDSVLRYNPDYCIVMFGANNNDLTRPERVLDEGELEQLMIDFQNRLPESCQRVGVVLNPIVNEKHWVTNHPSYQDAIKKFGGLNEMLEPERNQARDFYIKNGYPVVDLAKLMSKDPAGCICSDGIHLNLDGHKLFANALFDVLEQLLIRNGHDTNGK